jgi:ABC-2 type transport system ATP-binding protein
LCDQVALMYRGRPRAVGTPGELRSGLGPGSTLEDVFRHYTGADLADELERGGLRSVRSTRRTTRRVG